MSGNAVLVAFRAQADTGEGPLWNSDDGSLLWVDIPAGRLHTSDPLSGTTETLTIPSMLGAVALTQTGALVAACAEGFGLLDKGEFELRLPVLDATQRMNDAKCDPAGRFWAGSTDRDFTPGRGSLHMLSEDWTDTVQLDGLTLPNGLGWTADARTFYVADTLQQTIFAFDFDVNSGSITNQRTFVSLKDEQGLPDGFCLDRDDFLWLAMWGGSQVLRISPDGDIVARIAMPVSQPSSCAFGGENFDTLYITSARKELQLPTGALDGSVFAVRDTGAVGLPAARFGASGASTAVQDG